MRISQARQPPSDHRRPSPQHAWREHASKTRSPPRSWNLLVYVCLCKRIWNILAICHACAHHHHPCDLYVPLHHANIMCWAGMWNLRACANTWCMYVYIYIYVLSVCMYILSSSGSRSYSRHGERLTHVRQERFGVLDTLVQKNSLHAYSAKKVNNHALLQDSSSLFNVWSNVSSFTHAHTHTQARPPAGLSASAWITVCSYTDTEADTDVHTLPAHHLPPTQICMHTRSCTDIHTLRALSVCSLLVCTSRPLSKVMGFPPQVEPNHCKTIRSHKCTVSIYI
jgi:hypothetical protein